MKQHIQEIKSLMEGFSYKDLEEIEKISQDMQQRMLDNGGYCCEAQKKEIQNNLDNMLSFLSIQTGIPTSTNSV